MSAEMLSALLTGEVAGIQMNEVTLLGVSMLMEISIVMVLLSRVLNRRANRWANIIAGSIKTIVMIGTLLMGASYHYVFFATIEIATSLFIVWYAWRWVDSEATEVAS
ncbi:MAG: DUF6326 family protein [Marinoscillum sp.]|uniref:DUF6326 family protein n=1 Tax=Marinoscillum sp. TaxID=2024838 RepID=UPI0032F949AB